MHFINTFGHLRILFILSTLQSDSFSSDHADTMKSNIYLTFNWTASSEFGTYRLCEQRRFRRACASAQSRQNLRCSLIQAVSQEEPLDRKPDPCPLWMAGHAKLKFVMTECSKTQIRLTGLNLYSFFVRINANNSQKSMHWNFHNYHGLHFLFI